MLWLVFATGMTGVEAGASIVVFASTGNALGWVWPPALFALVVWMTVRARGDLNSRARAWVLYPVFATLLLSAPRGRVRDVPGVRRRRCVPDGGPVDRRRWSPPPPELHRLGEPDRRARGRTRRTLPDDGGVDRTRGCPLTKVCVYDRAGRGWSKSADRPEDGVQVATDVHTLLRRAGVPGPYVLAEHSAGGLYVQNVAHLYPHDVGGMVLLDSMHPDQYTKIASYPSFYEMSTRVSAVLPSLSRLGANRLFNETAYRDLPASARDEERAFWSTRRHNRSLRDEFSQLRTAMAQAGALTSLGNRPLIVVTAKKDAEPGWMGLQNELAALSANRAHWILRDAKHEMLTEDKDTARQSSRATREVVDAVRNGTPVTGTNS